MFEVIFCIRIKFKKFKNCRHKINAIAVKERIKIFIFTQENLRNNINIGITKMNS